MLGNCVVANSREKHCVCCSKISHCCVECSSPVSWLTELHWLQLVSWRKQIIHLEEFSLSHFAVSARSSHQGRSIEDSDMSESPLCGKARMVCTGTPGHCWLVRNPAAVTARECVRSPVHNLLSNHGSALWLIAMSYLFVCSWRLLGSCVSVAWSIMSMTSLDRLKHHSRSSRGLCHLPHIYGLDVLKKSNS